MIDLQPTLQGDLVRLRPLQPEDWDALYAVASDPEIWAMHPMPDRYLEPVFRDYFAEAMASGGAFAIVDQQSGVIIGSTLFAGHDPVQSEIEIGWTFYARSHWRTGHNREVKALMLRHIFAFVETVLFRIGATNLRSRAAVERLGARLISEYLLEYKGRQVPYVSYHLKVTDAAKGALALDLTK
jgi:N-acetyltransferase